MSHIPHDLKYTETHEWVHQEADGTLTVGITDHAQEALGDLVYIELPEVGRHVEARKEFIVVESVKAASDVYAPVSGTVTEINEDLATAPESVNQDAYAAWLVRLQPDNPADVDALLDAEGYLAAADAH
ncbi:MAG: glycine cleavage system protein GcvH [Methylococcus sp.]|nr:MAG: glycine cleavage system protein GcvH [Methylococcus sp.]